MIAPVLLRSWRWDLGSREMPMTAFKAVVVATKPPTWWHGTGGLSK